MPKQNFAGKSHSPNRFSLGDTPRVVTKTPRSPAASTKKINYLGGKHSAKTPL